VADIVRSLDLHLYVPMQLVARVRFPLGPTLCDKQVAPPTPLDRTDKRLYVYNFLCARYVNNRSAMSLNKKVMCMRHKHWNKSMVYRSLHQFWADYTQTLHCINSVFILQKNLIYLLKIIM